MSLKKGKKFPSFCEKGVDKEGKICYIIKAVGRRREPRRVRKRKLKKAGKKDLTKRDRSARISKLSERAWEGVGCEAEKS